LASVQQVGCWIKFHVLPLRSLKINVIIEGFAAG
jgi:hypothetical protein